MNPIRAMMIYRELICETRLKSPEECLLQSPCGCSTPGQDTQCEDCPYLEACLSRHKSHEMSRNRKH